VASEPIISALRNLLLGYSDIMAKLDDINSRLSALDKKVNLNELAKMI
jgi:hypothetical protein